MAVQIILRKGTASEWTASNPTLASGELGYETDTKKLKIGNGTTAWNSLAYAEAPGAIPPSAITARGQIIAGSNSAAYRVINIGSAGQILVEDPVAGTLTYQVIALNDLPGVNVTGAVTNDLFARSSTQWEDQSFSTVLSASQQAVKDIIANNGVAGYFSRGAGYFDVYKLAFPTDAVSTTTPTPGVGMSSHAGFANRLVAGYFSDGNSTSVYKWAFPADTVTTTTAAPGSMSQHAGFANPAVAGYFSRGVDSSFVTTSTVYKWAFPADTVTTSTAGPGGMRANAGFANPSVAGYFSQGLDASGNITATVYKWAFPGDTVTTTTSAPATMVSHGGFVNPFAAGYFSRVVSASSDVYKWTFPTDTVSTTTAFPSGTSGRTGFANPNVAGYFARSANNATIYKFAFPTDTVTTTTNAPETMNSNAGFANA